MSVVFAHSPFKPSKFYRTGQSFARNLSLYKGFSVDGADRKLPYGALKRQRNAGFSLVELAAALVIIAILAAVALHKLAPILADAERTALENTVGILRSALGINVASYLAKADLQGIQGLSGSNPMELLNEPPKNYLGVLDENSSVGDGVWYFDRKRSELVYRVQHTEVFRGSPGQPAEARFAVRSVYEDRNRNGRYDAGDLFFGVRLEAMTPYHWVQD